MFDYLLYKLNFHISIFGNRAILWARTDMRKGADTAYGSFDGLPIFLKKFRKGKLNGIIICFNANIIFAYLILEQKLVGVATIFMILTRVLCRNMECLNIILPYCQAQLKPQFN